MKVKPRLGLWMPLDGLNAEWSRPILLSTVRLQRICSSAVGSELRKCVASSVHEATVNR